MSEKILSQENIRSEEEVNAVINHAILEIVDIFAKELTERDKYMLISVTTESTSPVDRISYLVSLPKTAVDISENMKGCINHILQTLRNQLTDSEKQKFRTWSEGGSLIDDI